MRKASLLLKSNYLQIQSLSFLCSQSHHFQSFQASPAQPSFHFAINPCRYFSSPPLNLDKDQGPASVDYRSVLEEDEYHKLADATIHDLQERFEEYGDSIEVDGFDIDYGNQVLTVKLGNLGTYVLNKQTPNRQLWLSSPMSGPSRFDWDRSSQAWVYRRTRENLLQLLETELLELCGKAINLS